MADARGRCVSARQSARQLSSQTKGLLVIELIDAADTCSRLAPSCGKLTATDSLLV